jgi:hypothetical protein
MDFSGYLLKTKETISVPDIVKQLEMAQVVLDEKGLVDFTANLIFKNGKLHASNDRLLVVSAISIKAEFTTNGFDFYKALSGITGEADLMTSADKILVSAKKVKAELSKWPMEDSALLLDQIDQNIVSQIDNFQDLPSNFWEGLDWCKFSASKDVSVRSITCVKIQNDKALSTDNYRMSRFIFDKDTGLDVLIPKENVDSLLKFPGLTKFKLLKQNDLPVWLCFLNPETGFVCGTRLVLGEFPDINPFFEKTGEAIKFPDELKDQVNRAGKFAEGIADEATAITIKMGNKSIITIATKASGTLEQMADIEYEGDELIFYTIPALFEQILNKVKKVTLCPGFLLFDVGQFSHVLQIKTDEEISEEVTKESDDIPF